MEEKENFLIFDCWNNFDWFNMHPEGREPSSTIALPARIFLTRINQYRILKDKEEGKEVLERIKKDIESLPKKTVSIREKRREIEMALSDKIWKNISINGFDFLQTKITPLMRFKPNINLNIETIMKQLIPLCICGKIQVLLNLM